MKRIGPALLLVVILLFGGQGTVEAQHFPSDDSLRSMLRDLVEEGQAPGVALGLLEADGSTRIVSYGSPGPEARSLGPRAVFEIGSINKVFTGALLAEMVDRGEVALDDPVSEYLPEQVTLPSRNGRQITLLDLATHTSGLPPIPDNYQPLIWQIRGLDTPWGRCTTFSRTMSWSGTRE